MPFDLNRYVKKPKRKRNCFHFLKYKYLKNKKNIINKLKVFLKFTWEIIYYGLIYLIGISILYEAYPQPEVTQCILTFGLLSVFFQHKSLKQTYKNWLFTAEYDKFYSIFVKKYSVPLLLPQLIIVFLLAKICSIGAFIILLALLFSYDLWDRRFITNDIKQDMILNKFEKEFI